METSGSTAMSGGLGINPGQLRVALGVAIAALALLACLMLPGTGWAGGKVRVDQARQGAKPSTGVEGLSLRFGARDGATGAAFGTRARKPRTWKMPVSVAQRESNSFARYMHDNSTPAEFDPSGSIIGDSWWDAYGVVECSRMTVSMVNCIAGVTADFDVVNDADQVVGQDTFFCIWEESYWYPRARTKRLKSRLVDALCGWESEL